MQAPELFAEIVEYPGRALADRVRQCVACLRPAHAGAAELLTAFGVRLAELSSARLQEIYTSAFDMRAEASLYVGHHLFGADARRSVFMAQLSREYRHCGLARTNDLPDHLPLMLRFLAQTPAADIAHELLVECLVPAVTTIVGDLEKHEHPYAPAFGALLLWLRDCAARLEQSANGSAV